MGKKPIGVKTTLHKATKIGPLIIKRATNSYTLKHGHIKAPRI